MLSPLSPLWHRTGCYCRCLCHFALVAVVVIQNIVFAVAVFAAVLVVTVAGLLKGTVVANRSIKTLHF